MRLVLMGVYGPIEPGTFLEEMAVQGLKDVQSEEMSRSKLMIYASIGVKEEEIRKAWKDYSASASPFNHAAMIRKDRKMKAEIEEEVKRGSFLITPMHDPTKDKITARTGERKSRKLRMKSKK